jgi:hypothetical protein
MSARMIGLQRLAADADPDAVIAAVDADGAVILDGAIEPANADQVMAELRPFIEATPLGGDDFVGRRTTRTGALVARSPQCRALVMHPAILAACDRFLLRACLRYRLHLTQAIRIRPGQPTQALHRDRDGWGGYLQGVEPQLNTIWAVTDFTRRNGATRVAPGSQTWARGRKAAESEIAYAEMQRGSVLIYSGSVVHGGGENASSDDRVGINITYALGWLRQEENQYLSCPPDIARDLDPALQALLGYSMAGYALGYFTPPLAPGEGPETVPPEFAVGGTKDLWGASVFEAAAARLRPATKPP